MKTYWQGGIMGVVTGDALGDPVQFESRQQVKRHPVTGMRGGGAYDMPAGTWTDDSSMTLATLASIHDKDEIDLKDIMDRFVSWYEHGEYTPYGTAFDEGGCTVSAILRYRKYQDPENCGGSHERDNGNGSLMRILPACLYCAGKKKEGTLTDEESVRLVHQVSALTHAHLCSMTGCGLYYFLTDAILTGKESGESLRDSLRSGLESGFAFYDCHSALSGEIHRYERLRDPDTLQTLPESEISSSGYVVDTLEAAVWCLLNTESFQDALLLAVNLGDDADTVGAVTGGLAGLYYGYDSIPSDWLEVIPKREAIEKLCREFLIAWEKNA